MLAAASYREYINNADLIVWLKAGKQKLFPLNLAAWLCSVFGDVITFSFICEDLQSGSQISFFFLSWLTCSLSGQTHKDVGEVISTKKMRKVTPVNFFSEVTGTKVLIPWDPVHSWWIWLRQSVKSLMEKEVGLELNVEKYWLLVCSLGLSH